jgi:hypothetical protein
MNGMLTLLLPQTATSVAQKIFEFLSKYLFLSQVRMQSARLQRSRARIVE